MYGIKKMHNYVIGLYKGFLDGVKYFSSDSSVMPDEAPLNSDLIIKDLSDIRGYRLWPSDNQEEQ